MGGQGSGCMPLAEGHFVEVLYRQQSRSMNKINPRT